MKENYFFKHDFNARTDPKMQNVLMEMGLAGIGMYWCVIEQLYEQGGELPLTSIRSIAFALHAEAADVERIISDFGLFRKDKKKFWSESVKRRIADREELSEKRSNAGKAGNRKRWNKASQTDNKSEHDVSQKDIICEESASQTDNITNGIATQEKSQSIAIKIEDKDKDKDKECVNIAHTHEELLKRFFRSENMTMLDKLCCDFGTDMETLKQMAVQISNEWTLTEQSHRDYNDASRHLISLIEKKLKSDDKPVKKNKVTAEQMCTGSFSMEEELRRHNEYLERKKNSISRADYLRLKAAEA